MHAEHTGVASIGPRECTLAHQCITDRRIDLLRKFLQFLGCIGGDHTTAAYDERTLGLFDDANSLVEIVRTDRGIVHGDRFRYLRFEVRFICRDILCHVHKHRSRSSALSDLECAAKR